MTNTNKAHEGAVELVKEELQESGYFSKVTEATQQSVDLQAMYNGKTCYFAVIRGRKQKSKSIYAAINSQTWKFAAKHLKELFFIAAIEEDGKYNYYCYTPTEMWTRTSKPYVHLKCNPLKKGTLFSIKETFSDIVSEDRYDGEKAMSDKLKDLSKLVGQLQTIKR